MIPEKQQNSEAIEAAAAEEAQKKLRMTKP
jgi:hypothetical protein